MRITGHLPSKHRDINFDGIVNLADVREFRILLRVAGIPTTGLARWLHPVSKPDACLLLGVAMTTIAGRFRRRILGVTRT